jgi:hypothetical protein
MNTYDYKVDQPVVFTPFNQRNHFDGIIESRKLDRFKKPTYKVHIPKRETTINGVSEYELKPF